MIAIVVLVPHSGPAGILEITYDPPRRPARVAPPSVRAAPLDADAVLALAALVAAVEPR